MSEYANDADTQELASIAAELRESYSIGEDDPWQGSPFQWIRSISSRSKGAVGEQLIEHWATAAGLDVTRSPDSEADRIIHGYRVEIKFSTLWKSGIYKFQQIRDQHYDFCLCLGISPFAAHAWLLPKSVLLERVIGVMGQHTGASGRDTAWLSITAARPDPWLAAHGGQLRDVYELLERAGKGPR